MPIMDATVEVVCDICSESDTFDMEWRYQSYNADSGFYSLEATVESIQRRDGYEIERRDGEHFVRCPSCIEDAEEDEEDED